MSSSPIDKPKGYVSLFDEVPEGTSSQSIGFLGLTNINDPSKPEKYEFKNPKTENAKQRKSKVAGFFLKFLSKILNNKVQYYALPARDKNNLIVKDEADPKDKGITPEESKANFLQDNKNTPTHQIKITHDGETELDAMAIFHQTNDKANFITESKDQTETQKWVILFCGNSTCYEHNLEFAKQYGQETNANVLVFNYRGVSNSTGNATSYRDLVNDGASCVEYLMNKGVSPENIVLHGQSLGGGVSVKVASRYNKKDKAIGVISSRSFSSYKKAATKLVAKLTHSKAIGKLAGKLMEEDWKLDAHNAWGNIPGNKKAVVYHKEDKVVGFKASLVRKTTKTKPKKGKYAQHNFDVLELKSRQKDAHNYSLLETKGSSESDDFANLVALTTRLLGPKQDPKPQLND